MSSILDLKKSVGQTETIKSITQAIGDIATTQIKQRRKSAELNIRYFQEILTLYKTVKQLAIHTKSFEKIEQEKNGQELLILVTSNYKFSGDLDAELTNFYLRNSTASRAARIVIGQSGAEIVSAKRPDLAYTKIMFKKDYPTYEELDGLVKQIYKYSKILVYHSKFVTLLNQDPTVTDITANEFLNNDVPVEKISFILEPEIDKMIVFFEDQMLLILLQAIFLESEIARIAARMISMNQAEQAAEKLLDKQKKSLFAAKKERSNMKIVESYASASIARGKYG